jgi:hypothetical protein
MSLCVKKDNKIKRCYEMIPLSWTAMRRDINRGLNNKEGMMEYRKNAMLEPTANDRSQYSSIPSFVVVVP